jgi:hypothetical protein
LIVVEEMAEGPFEEVKTFEEKADVKLFLNLLAAVVDGLHGLPAGSAAARVEQGVKDVPEEDEEVELVRRTRLLALVQVQVVACVYLE